MLDENYEQLDLLTNARKIERERQGQIAVNKIKTRFGKNAIMRGISLEEGATQKMRNSLIGGHASGEEN